jgi:hypothetical protein
MSRTTWRALRTELRRSTAPAAVLATLLLGAILMYSESSSWAGRWMPFAAAVRFSTLVLAPIAVALGTWQGGRERRRRTGEQLASTPRPRWQPLVVAWAGVTLGCWLGLLVVVAAGAALVAPVATYAGGGWWWLLAVTPVALAAMTAVGIALGRAAPSWVAAPIAMIVVYGLQVYAHDTGGLRGAEWLAPIVAVSKAGGRTVSGSVHLQQTLWFGGLATTVLVLAAARRRWLAVLPAAVAAAGAASLLSGPLNQGWERDLVATEWVCTGDEPQVCLIREEAFLLDDLTPLARDALARFEGVPGGPTRAFGSPYGPPPGGEPYLGLDTGRITITGELYRAEEWNVVNWYPDLACESPDAHERYRWMIETAAIWGRGEEPVPGWGPEVVDGHAALLAMPLAQRKEWIGQLIAAAGACDQAALDRLAERLA